MGSVSCALGFTLNKPLPVTVCPIIYENCAFVFGRISETNRVSVMTYSDYMDSKLSFGEGTNSCALRDAFKDLTHQKWTTRLEPVLREAFKKFRKSKTSCKVMCE